MSEFKKTFMMFSGLSDFKKTLNGAWNSEDNKGYLMLVAKIITVTISFGTSLLFLRPNSESIIARLP
jgi:hypothetical protein